MRRLPMAPAAMPAPATSAGVVRHDAYVVRLLPVDEDLTLAFVRAILDRLPPDERPDVLVECEPAVAPSALAGIAPRLVAAPRRLSPELAGGRPTVLVPTTSFREIEADLSMVILPSFAGLLHPRIHALRDAIDLVVDEVRLPLAAELAVRLRSPTKPDCA